MSRVEFDYYVDAISVATSFGDLVDGNNTPETTYRTIAKIVHPDLAADKLRDKATRATIALNLLWDAHNGKAPVDPTNVVATKKRTYVLGDQLAQGDVANLYSVVYKADNEVYKAVMKMPRDPRDNDLMEREAKALKLVGANADYRHFASLLVETFRHRDAASKATRRVNVFEPLDGFLSLAQLKDLFPDGLDPRHIAWVWRRLFVAIGLAHDNDIVHGAVVPEHIMIHPKMHGVVLTGWTSSCMGDQTIPLMVPGRKHLYPQSVRDKAVPTHAVDVAMAVGTMEWLGGSRFPRQFRAFARGCQLASPPTASELLGEFDNLIADMYGKRKYLELVLPS